MKKPIFLIVLVFYMFHFGLLVKANDNSKPTLLVGFFGGVNFSQPSSLKSFGVSNNIGTSSITPDKDYDAMFSNIGNQFGFAMFYPAFGNLHLGLLPSYSSYRYAYNSQQNWSETNGSTIAEETNHAQKLRYFEIPLVVRYYIGTANIKPYVEGVFSYGMLHTADKTAQTEIIRTNASSSSVIQNTSIKSDYGDSYITSKLDLGFGAGVSYDFNQLILMLGFSYYYNLNNITDEKNRYSNDLFVGNSYDVQDDLNLHALKINLSIIFPISKITKRSAIECHYFKKKRK